MSRIPYDAMHEAAEATTFYVMHEIDGDEVVEFHARTLAEAKQKIVGLPPTFERDKFSIWHSGGGMVAWLHAGVWIHNRRATA